MATDAQGRQLSEDGYYYWDGTVWQLVEQETSNAGAADSGAPAAERTPTNEDFQKVIDAQPQGEKGPEPG
jgi:hypothetical protein